jgi:hypothetical protein
MQRIRFVGYGGKVSGAGTLFAVFVLLNLKARDFERTVLFHSQMNRFREGEMARFVC